MSTKIILALDCSDGVEADKIVRLLFDYVDGFKINHTLYGLVDYILNINHPDKELFVDFKLWDTPNTVKKYICSSITSGKVSRKGYTFGKRSLKIFKTYVANELT